MRLAALPLPLRIALPEIWRKCCCCWCWCWCWCKAAKSVPLVPVASSERRRLLVRPAAAPDPSVAYGFGRGFSGDGVCFAVAPPMTAPLSAAAVHAKVVLAHAVGGLLLFLEAFALLAMALLPLARKRWLGGDDIIPSRRWRPDPSNKGLEFCRPCCCCCCWASAAAAAAVGENSKVLFAGDSCETTAAAVHVGGVVSAAAVGGVVSREAGATNIPVPNGCCSCCC